MLKKLIILIQITTIFSASCSYSEYEYDGNCYSSCRSINKFYYGSSMQCVSSCKSLNLQNFEYDCKTCSSIYYVINNPNDMDDFCVRNCFAFGKKEYSARCMDNCKENGLIDYKRECISSCNTYYLNTKLATQNEDYCVTNCLVYGLYNHDPCQSNCKSIGKFLYDGECRSSCSYPLNYLYTEEENYCLRNCYYQDLVRSDKAVCVESCKSIGQMLGVSNRGECQTSYNGYKMVIYNNENILTSDCNLYDKVIGPSNNCVKNCKAIGKVQSDGQCYDSCGYYYPYEYEDESYCLTQQQCRNVGRYPINQNGVDICSEECTGSKCNSQCGENQYYSVPDSKCVDSCRTLGLYLYNDKYCIKACPIFVPHIFKSSTEDICTKDCPEEAPYLNYDSGVCIDKCDNYIFDGNKCLTSCPTSKQYVNTIDGQKYCVKNCHEYGLYNTIEEMLCTDNCKKYSEYLVYGNCFKSCPANTPYKYEGEDENKCLKDCSEIGLLTDLVLNVCTTNCKKSGKKLFEGRCLSSCPYTARYIYSTNEEDYCVESCALYNQKSI